MIIDNLATESMRRKITAEDLNNVQCMLPNFRKLITSRENISCDIIEPKPLEELPPPEAEKLFRAFYKGRYDKNF